LNGKDAAELITLLLLLCMSAFFSSAETALTTVSKIRIRTLAEQGNRKAAMLLKVTGQPEKMLSVILIGNNVVNLYASALVTAFTIRAFGSGAVGLATGVVTLLVLVFGEITPKTVANRNAEKIALDFAGPVNFLMIVFTPVVAVVNALSSAVMKVAGSDGENANKPITEEDLRTIVEVSREEGVIENEEKKIINNVFDFGDTLAKDIMVPRIDMTFIKEDASYEELISVFRKDKYTRIPVYRDTTDTVTGIINMKDLLLRDPGKKFSISDYLREPLFTYEYKKTAELMIEMRRACTNIAIVLDEYGLTSGMVTLEDLLEEIVGEIRDEYDVDEEKDIRKAGPSEYILDGATRLDDLNESLGLHLESEDYESVGGLVMGLLDHMPEPGEEVNCGGIRLIVEKTDKNRVDKVRLFLPEKGK
jgi:putative hemolysin